jgi:D-alanyl-D-alanine dipeptidase
MRTAVALALLCAGAGRTFGPQELPEVRDQEDPLVDAEPLVPGLIVDLRYATPDNVTGRALYPQGARCLLRRSAAERLATAARALAAERLRLVAWDCWRSAAAQAALWKAHPHPGSVADPRRGSLHQRGVAVDLGLADLEGRMVPLPTAFDAFGPEAAAEAPVADPRAKANRDALSAAMYAAGFRVNPKEWWHFSRVWGWRWPVSRKPR